MKKYDFYFITLAWRKHKQQYVKMSTMMVYQVVIKKHLKKFFGYETDISEKKIQQFIIEKINLGLSINTIKGFIVVLKMILKFGIKHYQWQHHVLDLQYPSEEKFVKREILTKKEQKKIINYLNDNFNFKNLGILITLSTGVRIGEICSLVWEDIDLQQKQIIISKTIQRIQKINPTKKKTEIIISSTKSKNGFRVIPLSNNLIKFLKPLKKIINSQYFLLSNSLKPIEPRLYRTYYYKILELLNINKIKFHGLRHGFATRLIETKADYKTVSSLLGHANIRTTLDLYVHPSFEDKKKCIEKMLKIFH